MAEKKISIVFRKEPSSGKVLYDPRILVASFEDKIGYGLINSESGGVPSYKVFCGKTTLIFPYDVVHYIEMIHFP